MHAFSETIKWHAVEQWQTTIVIFDLIIVVLRGFCWLTQVLDDILDDRPLTIPFTLAFGFLYLLLTFCKDYLKDYVDLSKI